MVCTAAMAMKVASAASIMVGVNFCVMGILLWRCPGIDSPKGLSIPGAVEIFSITDSQF
jgi:hypothetical protein